MTSEVMSLLGRADMLEIVPSTDVLKSNAAPSPFGSLLRRHRSARGMSQERLAHDAEISPRHLSCLETGRAAPSKSMVLIIGSALDLPLRDRNALLEAAGFVAAYRDVPLQAPEAASLRRAIDLVLNGIEPNGAIAVDRAWNLIQMNQGAARLFAAFCDLPNAPPEVLQNALVATLHPAGLRPFIMNFDEVAALLLDRARREESHCPADDPEILRVRELVAKIPNVPTASDVALGGKGQGPFLTVHMKRGDLEARLFTTISTIGTPIDATAEDIRIETYFPADEATSLLVKRLADSSRSG
jgi:transcriptional regulator with XRE-family HTH domain